jgi:hypothetical protein
VPHQSAEIDTLNEVGGHCPRCGAEYRPGFTQCSDCGVHLVPGPTPAEVPAVPAAGHDLPESQIEAVCALPWNEAWLMAGRLRAEGIPAWVYPDSQEMPISAAQLIPATRASLDSVGLGRATFEVLVPEERADEARRRVGRYTR